MPACTLVQTQGLLSLGSPSPAAAWDARQRIPRSTVSPPSSKLPLLLRLRPALPLPSHRELCCGTIVSCHPSVRLHRRVRGTRGNASLAPVWPSAQGIGPATTHACEVRTSSATAPAYRAAPVLIGGSPCLRAPSLVATWKRLARSFSHCTGGSTNLTISPAALFEHIRTPKGAMPGVKHGCWTN
jgi:hypothetical protein